LLVLVGGVGGVRGVCVWFGLWVVWVVFVVCFGGWLVLFSKREGRVSDTQNWVVIMFQLIRS
jgi:uncharacterized iron-regulated membrane protein